MWWLLSGHHWSSIAITSSVYFALLSTHTTCCLARWHFNFLCKDKQQFQHKVSLNCRCAVQWHLVLKLLFIVVSDLKKHFTTVSNCFIIIILYQLMWYFINSKSSKLNNLNFHPLEVVARYPTTTSGWKSLSLRPTIWKSLMFKHSFYFEYQWFNLLLGHINPWSTELFNLNFQSLEVVSRYRDTQLRVTENLCYLWRLSANISAFQNWRHILLWTAPYQGSYRG